MILFKVVLLILRLLILKTRRHKAMHTHEGRLITYIVLLMTTTTAVEQFLEVESRGAVLGPR